MFGLHTTPLLAPWPRRLSIHAHRRVRWVRSVPRPVIAQRRVRIFRSASPCAWRDCANAFPMRRSGSSTSTRRAVKDRLRQLVSPRPPSGAWEHRLRPGRRRVGDDVPVDLKAGDHFQHRLVGPRVRPAGPRDVLRDSARQHPRIVADYGEAGGARLKASAMPSNSQPVLGRSCRRVMSRARVGCLVG